MTGAELLLKFKGDRVLLSKEASVALANTNVSNASKPISKFTGPAAWKVSVKLYDPLTKWLHVDVLENVPAEQDFPQEQATYAGTLREVRALAFHNIKTHEAFKSALAVSELASTPLANREADYGHISHRITPPALQTSRSIEEDTPVPIPQPPNPVEESPVKVVTQTINLPFGELHFVNGGASFQWYMSELGREVEFTIFNEHLKWEFGAVKEYFPKVLGVKNVVVRIRLEFNTLEKSVVACEAQSEEISRIDKQTIDRVRLTRADHTRKIVARTNPDKKIWTRTEIFNPDRATGSPIPDPFYTNETELLDDFLKITDTKHYRHLKYLEGKHAHTIMMLRFVLKPFSYLFLLQGAERNHIVWETLDTEEATYVWHFDKNVELLRTAHMKQLEENIGRISAYGKRAYMKAPEGDFHRIIHDYSAGDDGFAKWREELVDVLV